MYYLLPIKSQDLMNLVEQISDAFVTPREAPDWAQINGSFRKRSSSLVIEKVWRSVEIEGG